MNQIPRHHQPIERDERPRIGTDGTGGPIIAVRGRRRGFRRSGGLRPAARRRRMLVVVLAAVMVAGCSSNGSTAGHGASGSSTTSTVAQAAAHGVEAPIGAIPWSQVGPGWLLATWSPAVDTGHGQTPPPGAPTPETATTTLYLVDPAGGRYPITTFAPGDTAGGALVDWSGDGSRALFHTGDTAISVDLHTGKQTTLFTVPGGITPRFTRPDGAAILLSSNGNGFPPGPATLKRVDLAGNPQLTYPTDKLGSTFHGRYLPTPDGAQLVLGTDNGLVLMSNDGVVGRQLPSPMPGADCEPVRWWTSTAILASCTVHTLDPSKTSAVPTQLWQVPLNGGAPTALTAVNPQDGSDPAWNGDFADLNAWQLPSGTYLQSTRSCGPGFLSRLTPDKHTTNVPVPGVGDRPANGAAVVGVDGADLDLMAITRGCSGGGQSQLVRYDPAANTPTVLLGPPVNAGSVINALPYTGQE